MEMLEFLSMCTFEKISCLSWDLGNMAMIGGLWDFPRMRALSMNKLSKFNSFFRHSDIKSQHSSDFVFGLVSSPKKSRFGSLDRFSISMDLDFRVRTCLDSFSTDL